MAELERRLAEVERAVEETAQRRYLAKAFHDKCENTDDYKRNRG
ncbi:hypothetical protein O1L55_05350 [Streptomyces albulus]|nr:hypothetical protein [Streptomyces noursei]